jgi:hypothetical protein
MFNSYTVLPERIAIYVPSTVNVNEPASAEIVQNWVTETRRFLSTEFGGATSIAAIGSWNSNGVVITEDVTIVYAFASKLTDVETDKVFAFAAALRDTFSQEAVSVEINGKLVLV